MLNGKHPDIHAGPHVSSQEEVAKLQRLYEIRCAVKTLKNEESQLMEELESIPDGFRMSLPGSGIKVLRSGPNLYPRVLDITAVPPEFVKSVGDIPGIRRHFLRTRNEPPGVEVRVDRGTLSLRI